MVTAPARKTGRPKNELLTARRRAEILHAAAHVFAARGYPNTDLQVVADTLKIGKGTIYRYFPSKRDLFLAAVDQGMQRLQDLIDATLAGVDDPFEKIAVGIRTYLAYFDEHPETAELLIQERAEFRDRKKPTYFEYCDAAANTWQVIFETLIQQGRVRKIPVERILDVFGNLMYGTMFTNFFMGPNKSFEDQAHDIVDIAFFGILSPKEQLRQKRFSKPA